LLVIVQHQLQLPSVTFILQALLALLLAATTAHSGIPLLLRLYLCVVIHCFDCMPSPSGQMHRCRQTHLPLLLHLMCATLILDSSLSIHHLHALPQFRFHSTYLRPMPEAFTSLPHAPRPPLATLSWLCAHIISPTVTQIQYQPPAGKLPLSAVRAKVI
jgi:hypothetical protein